MSQALPRIGITCKYADPPSTLAPVIGVRGPYLSALLNAEALPVMIPLLPPGAWLEQLYASLDGLLIPGGEDVNPTRYGEAPHPKLGRTCDLRDEVESILIRKARSDQLPLMGICRGIQIINVALGGTLYQDIESQYEGGAAAHPDRSPSEDTQWNTEAHQITIEKTSRLAQILELERVSVNSLHHQAIKKPAPCLKVSAYADDKLIEAVEAQDQHFLVALQCHPETLCLETEACAIVRTGWHRLFDALVAASVAWRLGKG